MPERGDVAEVPVPDRSDAEEPREQLADPGRRAHGRAARRPGRLRLLDGRRTQGWTRRERASRRSPSLLLLLGNAFFVGAEFALVSARRSQIEPRAEAGSRMAKTTLRAMENISLVIAVNQLGITVCSLVLGAVGEPAVAHLLEPVLRRAARARSRCCTRSRSRSRWRSCVYLHVVLGEMIPKNIALAGPDRAALVLGPPIWAIVTVLGR